MRRAVLSLAVVAAAFAGPAWAGHDRATVSPASVAEASGSVRVDIRVCGQTPAVVTWKTEDGTARAGEDYLPVEGRGEVTSDDRVVSFDLRVVPDDAAEGDEVLYLWVDTSQYTGGQSTPEGACRTPGPTPGLTWSGPWAPGGAPHGIVIADDEADTVTAPAASGGAAPEPAGDRPGTARDGVVSKSAQSRRPGSLPDVRSASDVADSAGTARGLAVHDEGRPVGGRSPVASALPAVCALLFATGFFGFRLQRTGR